LHFIVLSVYYDYGLGRCFSVGAASLRSGVPKIIGCTLGNYETLASGLIAASAALFAGWLAWSGVQVQIEAEERRASADRVEVEALLREDVDNFAEVLASIWKVLDSLDLQATNFEQSKIEAVSYGIDAISKENWLSTSRRMVTILGWDRRRRYEQLFDGLEGLRQFRTIGNAWEALNAVKGVSIDFEVLQPETSEYFKGLFRRGGKAWTLGYAVAKFAGMEEQYVWPGESKLQLGQSGGFTQAAAPHFKRNFWKVASAWLKRQKTKKTENDIAWAESLFR
jgi:hypothetical protein